MSTPSWKPCQEESHTWEYVPNWMGRYRCTTCGVLGYKGVILPDGLGRKRQGVIPYRCPKCHGPTTKFHYKQVGEFRGTNGAQRCPKCVG